MLNDFGNVNNMCRRQFKTSIEYYTNKIKTMQEDTTISEKSKGWFISNYEQRIKSLEETLLELENNIATSKNSGVFVNEEEATLNKLGTSSSETDNFNKYAQDEERHLKRQRWKIIGAILLPVVGTIPFLVSWSRSKKRFQEIDERIKKENIELGNFVSDEKRPYDKTLLTSTKFTESDMTNILDNPAEISRLEKIALSSTISPVEKKNLTKKLVELREYAQKNSYDTSKFLLGKEFQTKTDSTNNKISEFETTVNATASNANNLKEAYDAIKTLENIKAEMQSLYNETKNKTLETLLPTVDSKLTALRASAKTSITAGVDAIVSAINAVTASNDKASYESAIQKIDKTAVAESANFGTSITATQAKKMAEEIGIDDQTEEYKKFNEIETTRITKKQNFETELSKVKNEEELKSNISKNISELESVLKTKLEPLSQITDIETNINEINIKEAFIYLAEAKSAYDYLEQKISSLSQTDKSKFTPLQKEYLDYKAKLEKKNKDFASKAENFDSYKNDINTEIDTSKDNDTLNGELEMLRSTLTIIESAEYKEKMNKLGLSAELNKLISTAKTKITKYEKLIKQNEINAENEKHNKDVNVIISENQIILDSIEDSKITSFKNSSDILFLDNYEQQINNVIESLSKITSIETLNDETKQKLRNIKQTAQSKFIIVKQQLSIIKQPEELKNKYENQKRTIQNTIAELLPKLTAPKGKQTAVNQLELCVADLEGIKAEAQKYNLNLQLDSYISSLKTIIDETKEQLQATSSHS